MNEQEHNQQQFFEMLLKIDPELYIIKIALEETGVNPMLLPKIIRTISNLCLGTGSGKIQIFMESKMIKTIKPEETVYVNEEAVIK